MYGKDDECYHQNYITTQFHVQIFLRALLHEADFSIVATWNATAFQSCKLQEKSLSVTLE